MSDRIIIDSNLLLLLVVGEADHRWIVRHKGLKAYDRQAFDLLVRTIGTVSKLIVSPNVLTEVSNLACQGIDGRACLAIRAVLARVTAIASEDYQPSARATVSAAYHRLGLTDPVLILQAELGAIVWTDDLDLYLALSTQRKPVGYFTHLRRELGHI